MRAFIRLTFVGIGFVVLASQAAGDELADLQDQRIETLQQAVKLIETQCRAGEAPIQQLLDAHASLLDANLDAASTPTLRVHVLKQQLALSASAEKFADARRRSGQANLAEFLLAKAARLRIELMLLKEKNRGVDDRGSLRHVAPGQQENADVSPSKRSLVGEWDGTVDGDNRFLVTFRSNGTFELVNVDPAMPKRVKVRATGTYSGDFSVSPAHLDLDASIFKPKRDEPVKHKFELIIEIVDINKLRISDLSLPSRPKAFGKRSMVMQRQGDTQEVPK